MSSCKRNAFIRVYFFPTENRKVDKLYKSDDFAYNLKLLTKVEGRKPLKYLIQRC